MWAGQGLSAAPRADGPICLKGWPGRSTKPQERRTAKWPEPVAQTPQEETNLSSLQIATCRVNSDKMQGGVGGRLG
jgi:hypothetical protein